MQRNWEIIREILLETEKLKHDQTLKLNSFEDDRADEISYHIELLDEAGIVNVNIYRTLDTGPNKFALNRLTWAGHELLDAIRSDTIWKKTKSTFKEKGVEMTVDLVIQTAKAIAKAAMGL